MSTDEQHELVAQGQLIEAPRSDAAILVSQAIQQDLDISKVTELINFMREQTEIDRKQRAQEAYLKAKAQFLGKCPVITADKAGPKWNYASYGKILEVALPLMAKVGLSHTTTPDFEAKVVTCTMKHTLGHEESATFPMTLEGQQNTGAFKLTLQQQWAGALTFAERQSFKAVSGVPTSDSDVDMLPLAEPAASDQDPLARTATAAEYESMKSGWWKFAQPAEGTPERAEFDSLVPGELGDLYMVWVYHSIDGVHQAFMIQDEPHKCFTARQIVDLWAIINKDKEGKNDVSTEPVQKPNDHD